MWLDICSLSILFPIFTGLYFWKKLSIYQGYFLGFVVFSLIVEAVSFYTSIYEIKNLWIFKLFLFTDLAFFIWFFNKIHPFPNWLKLFSGSMLIFIPIWEIAIRFIKHKPEIESLFFILIFLYFVIQSGKVLIDLFDNIDLSPMKSYVFWIASARLMYYLFILFIFVFPHLMNDSFNNIMFKTAFTVINTTGNILCNIMYGISFYGRKY